MDEPTYIPSGSELTAYLEKMLERAKAGELQCFAARVFNKDGTWEDVAAGGTEEQRAALLAKVQKRH